MEQAKDSADGHIKKRLAFISKRSRQMIGYPEHIGGYYHSYYPEMFTQFIINVGNPFTEAKNYSLQTKDFERKVLHYFMDLYALDRNTTYGYIGNGTTEGSLYAIYRAREALGEPTLFFLRNIALFTRKNCAITSHPLSQNSYGRNRSD